MSLPTFRRIAPWLLSLGLGLLGAGCSFVSPPQADPTRYYVLTPQPPPAGSSLAGELRIGLRIVVLPRYLDTRAMVVRRDTNEVELEDYSRWAEPLADGITRTVRAQLEASPEVGRLYIEPFPLDAGRDYDVAITIDRCEGQAAPHHAGTARFAASIEISTPPPESRLVARRGFVAPDAAWNGKDFGQLAALLSQDAAALGRAAAEALPPGK